MLKLNVMHFGIDTINVTSHATQLYISAKNGQNEHIEFRVF